MPDILVNILSVIAFVAALAWDGVTEAVVYELDVYTPQENLVAAVTEARKNDIDGCDTDRIVASVMAYVFKVNS